jgi:hypothetical protein
MADDPNQLSDVPAESQDEVADEMSKAAAEALRQAPEELIDSQQAVVQELKATIAEVDGDELQQAINSFLFGADPPVQPRLIIEDPDPILEMDRAQVQKGIAQSTLEQREYNVSRWALVTAGVSSVGVVLSAAFAAYAALRSPDNSQGPVVPAGPDVTALLNGWDGLPDSQFWDAVGAYIEANKNNSQELTLADQYQFLTYVMDLWPLTEPFTWSGSDAVTARDFFLAQYADNGNDTGTMYLAVPTYMYQKAALPRAVAAQVLQWAVASLIVAAGPNSSHAQLSAV